MSQDNFKQDNYNYLFKISLLGEGGVGKTTLIRRYIDGIFIEDTKMTIGVDFYSKIVKIEDNNGINACKYIIWDLGGQQQFKPIHKNYLNGTMGALFLFDMSRTITLSSKIEEWLSILEEVGSNDIPIFLVGSKYDLIQGDRERFIKITKLALEVKNKYNFEEYHVTSSKTGLGIKKPFLHLVSEMLSRLKAKK